MGSKKKPPSAPKLVAPQPTAEEKQLLQQQIQLTGQLADQSNVAFQQGQQDRQTAEGLFRQLQEPNALSEEERRLAQELGDSLFSARFNDVTEGQANTQLNRARRDSLINLINGGVLNSTTGTELLGDIEKERLRLIDNASNEARLRQLGLEVDFLNQGRALDLDLFKTITGQSGGNTALGGQLASGAAGIAGQAGSQLQQQRMLEFQVQSQNAQADFLQKNAAFNRRGGLGGTIGNILGTVGGAALGLALAPATGGMSTLLSAGLGAGIGGGVGGSIGGLF